MRNRLATTFVAPLLAVPPLRADDAFTIKDPFTARAVASCTTYSMSGGSTSSAGFSSAGQVVIIDLSTPGSPQLVKVIDRPGVARGVAVSGSNEIVVADSAGEGLTFIDVTNKQAPVIKGSQPVAGNAADVKVVGRTVYVAADHVVGVVNRP